MPAQGFLFGLEFFDLLAQDRVRRHGGGLLDLLIQGLLGLFEGLVQPLDFGLGLPRERGGGGAGLIAEAILIQDALVLRLVEAITHILKQGRQLAQLVGVGRIVTPAGGGSLGFRGPGRSFGAFQRGDPHHTGDDRHGQSENRRLSERQSGQRQGHDRVLD